MLLLAEDLIIGGGQGNWMSLLDLQSEGPTEERERRGKVRERAR